jgi:hypothetical protein
MNIQIKNTFDKITKNNIVRGFFHTALTSALIAGVLAGLNFLTQQDFGNPMVTMMVTQFAGLAYNTVKEYGKGEEPNLNEKKFED